MSETDLATIEQRDRVQAGMCDIRVTMMDLPATQMAVVQQEYMDRRRQFRDWLKSVLIEGIHFGYPPSCQPKINDRGEVGVWNSKTSKMEWFPKEQWTAKPSFYKAGAQFICDLLNLVPTFQPDVSGWQMLGSIPGTFVIKCQLYPRGADRTPENVTGEGFGVRRVGDKGGDANNALKMAEKCALVDSVLNSFGLSDMFTQDIEDGSDRTPEPGINPNQRAEPKTPPRDKRSVDPAILERHQKLGARWKSYRVATKQSITSADFSSFICAVSNVEPTETMKPAAWTHADFEAVESAVDGLEKQ